MIQSKQEMRVYHQENPHIYAAFEKFTFQVIEAGRKNFSACGIIERIRWFTMIESKTGTFKVSENMKPFYARLFEEKHPQYKGFFRKRRSVADEIDDLY